MIQQKVEDKKQKQEEEKLSKEKEQQAANEQDGNKENEDTTNIDDTTNVDDKDKENGDSKEELIENNEKEEDDVEEKEESIVMPWDEPLKDQNMCRRLHYFWNDVEQSYIDDITATFELLRHERRRVLAYLASTREYFYNFLRRSDGKQKMIDEFQMKYNEIHPDMRRDDDTKDELHQRIQELSFQLFEYTMKRKNEAIQELDTIKNSVWLSTESNTLLKIMIGVIQYELNRYISTIRVVQDYFSLKSDKSISEDSTQPIDLLSIIQENAASTSNNKSKSGKKGKDKKAEANDKDTINDINITLDKLQNAVTIALQQIIQQPQQNENNQGSDNEEKDMDQFNELQNDIIKDENERLKMRLTRLSTILSYYLQDINDRHNNLIEKLDKWIGLRIDSENSAIDTLVQHIQKSIEKESELNFRLLLQGQNFLIDQDVIVYPMPNPIQKKKSNHKLSTKGAFTASQLRKLIELFRSQNVNGIIEYKSILEILKRLSNNAFVQNEPMVPLLWNNLNDEKLYVLLSPFIIPYQDNRYVNWKLFIVSLMLQTLSIINNTVTIPSLDTLFDLKQALNAKDDENTGKLNEATFCKIELWFDNTTNNVWQQILLELFGCDDNDDDSTKEKLINYNQLLYHLCFNDQSCFGFGKIIGLMQNVNIVDTTKIVTDQEWNVIQFRTKEYKDIGIDVNKVDNKDFDIIKMKEMTDIVESFNCISISGLQQ